MEMTNEFTIPKPLTFKYNISIDKENSDFHKIKNALSNSMWKYYVNYRRTGNPKREENYENFTYYVLNDLFQKRFFFTGNLKAYLTDYSEYSGSLIISFTILVVGTITNYGSIRDTIDRLAEDIEGLFRDYLNEEIPGISVTSNVQEQNNQQISLSQQNRTNETNQFKTLLSKSNVDRVLIGIIFFILILLLGQNYFVGNDNSKQSNTDEFKIRSIIKDELRNQKIDELLKTKTDTVYLKTK